MPERVERNLSRKSKTRLLDDEDASEGCASNAVLRRVYGGDEIGAVCCVFQLEKSCLNEFRSEQEQSVFRVCIG